MVEVVSTEVSPPELSSDLDHTGMDMFMALFVKRDNSRTWVCPVDGYGEILHTGQGQPRTIYLASGKLAPEAWSTGKNRYLADPDSTT